METYLIQKQEQELHLSQLQIQNLELLQMNEMELEQYIEKIAQENPLIDLKDVFSAPPAPADDRLTAKWQWLKNADHQNAAYKPQLSEDGLDFFDVIGNAGGLEITLSVHLREQTERRVKDPSLKLLLSYLAEMLDRNGYLRYSDADIAADTGFTEETVKKAVQILQSFDPAGVGARDLGECLALQLKRIGAPESAVLIASKYLPDVARGRIHAVSLKASCSEEEVTAAEKLIRTLDPYPAAEFAAEEQPVFICPDVYVTLTDGRYTVLPLDKNDRLFTVNKFYYSLLKMTDDRETEKYLKEKMAQIDNLTYGLSQRRSTLEEISRIIVERQQEFFSRGKAALRPMILADIAEELNLHISTVSRAVKDKYLQYPGGVVPMKVFFQRALPQSEEGEGAYVSPPAVKNALAEMIRCEDPARPLSDQKLSDSLAKQGFAISRRTVAKYREEFGIPGTPVRKKGYPTGFDFQPKNE